MTAPRTRLDEAESDFERELLRSYESEGPSAASRRKAMAILGGTGVAAALTTTTAASATATKAFGLLAIAKWLAVGAIVAGGSVATYALTTPETAERAAPPAPLAMPTPIVSAVVPPPVPVEPPAPEPPPAPVVRAPIAAPVVVSASASAEPPPPPPADPPPKVSSRALGDQVALLDRARAALSGGDATAALALVDDYDARFPGGALAQESATLRIEALLRQGKRQEATALGQRFVASQPKSPYAAKIRRLLDLP